MKNKREMMYQSQFGDIDLNESEINTIEAISAQTHQCNLCGAITEDNFEGLAIGKKQFICKDCVSKWNRLAWWEKENVRLNPDYIGIRDYRTPGAHILTIFLGIVAVTLGMLLSFGLACILYLIIQPDNEGFAYRALIGFAIAGMSCAFPVMYGLTAHYIKKLSFLFYCEDNDIPVKKPSRK